MHENHTTTVRRLEVLEAVMLEGIFSHNVDTTPILRAQSTKRLRELAARHELPKSIQDLKVDADFRQALFAHLSPVRAPRPAPEKKAPTKRKPAKKKRTTKKRATKKRATKKR